MHPAQPRLAHYTQPVNRQSTTKPAARRMPLTPILVAKIQQMWTRGYRDDIAFATLSLFNEHEPYPLSEHALTLLFLTEWVRQRRSAYITSLWKRLEAGQ